MSHITYKSYGLVIVLAFTIVFTGCTPRKDDTTYTSDQEVTTNTPQQDIDEILEAGQDTSSIVAPTNPDDYAKPEGWLTYTHPEYGFIVDYPENWNYVSSSGFTFAQDGLRLQTNEDDDRFSLKFAIHTENDGVEIPEPNRLLHIIQGNEELISIGGEAFEYFDNAYINGKSENSIDEGFFTSDEDWDFIDNAPHKNMILAHVDMNHSDYKKNIEIMKMIVLSFRMDK